MVIHTVSMQVEIPRGFPQQPSRDSDAHVCAYQMPSTCRGASFYLEPSNHGHRIPSCISTEASPKSHGALMRRQIRTALHSCLAWGPSYSRKNWAQRPPRRSAVALVASRIESTNSGSRSSGSFSMALGLRSSPSNGFAATPRCAAKSRSWRAIWSAQRRSGCSDRSKTPSAVFGVAEVGALYQDDAASPTWPDTPTSSTGRSLQKDPCQAVLRWRRRVHRRHGPTASGTGPDAAPSSALSPSRSGSQWAARSLRGEAPHPVLVDPCRVCLDELQQLFGKCRAITQIVPWLLVDGSYPIPSSHWSFPVAEEFSGSDAAARRQPVARSSASRPQ
jgi:hypothetical protein